MTNGSKFWCESFHVEYILGELYLDLNFVCKTILITFFLDKSVDGQHSFEEPEGWGVYIIYSAFVMRNLSRYFIILKSDKHTNFTEEAVPSPMAYNTGRSVKHLYKASPSFTIVRKDYSQERWVKNSKFNVE